ncbi:hypothetical protein JI59_02160 [Novosphingobium pentaromativorans US6-1]|nr:hypothetical protein JI59_02160 [Novosphingobium pentaromativorans US6-1]
MIVNNKGQLLAFYLLSGSQRRMEQTAICEALQRIEAALARVEGATRQAVDLRGRHEALIGQHEALATRHVTLKSSVEQSLSRIDGLIGRADK